MNRIKTAVILAAGMGTRLNSVTGGMIPKGFLEVNGKSLIERSIEKLRNTGIEKIYIVTGHLNEFYDKFAEDKDYIITRKSENYRTTGSMTSLAVLKDELKEDFLLLESDLIYEERALRAAAEYEEKDCILMSGKTNSGDECYIEVRDNNLYKISKDKSELKEVYGELVGISKISMDLFKEMMSAYDVYMSGISAEELENGEARDSKARYDYESAVFDAAKYRKVGYLKIDDLIWGEIDDAGHLKRINKKIIPKIEKVLN